MSATTKEKPNWKKWDELLIDAWEKDVNINIVIRQFLVAELLEDIQKMHNSATLREVYEQHGITSRAPKNSFQIHCGTRAFFFQFFPTVNDLLWMGQKEKALAALRKYRTPEKTNFKGEKEMQNIARGFYTKKSSAEFPIIAGTNAMSIGDTRKPRSDWNTVKPSRYRDRVSKMR